MICNSSAWFGLFKCSEQRRYWLTHLKVDGTILDLHQHVVVKLSVQRLEVVVRCTGPVIFRIAPVHVVVVDKSAIQKQSAMGLQRAGQRVRCVGVRSVIGRGADSTFRIRLQDEATQIGDRLVDFGCFRSPPLNNTWIEWIKGVQTSHALRASEVDRDGNLNTRRAQRIGNPGHLRNEFWRQYAPVGIHVVDGASVDADRGQQAPVVGNALKSSRTCPASQKIERPPYPRSIVPSRLSHWFTQRSRA